MLLLTITSFTTKEIYSEIAVTIHIFYVKVTHIFIYTLETETDYIKAFQWYITHIYLTLFFFKVNLCSVLSNSSSIN